MRTVEFGITVGRVEKQNKESSKLMVKSQQEAEACWFRVRVKIVRSITKWEAQSNLNFFEFQSVSAKEVDQKK